MTDTMRAAILLDVDGPLNPFQHRERARPPGYSPHLLWPKVPPGVPSSTVKVWLNPEHGVWLRKLAMDTEAELVWATSWEYEADRLIGPVLGLPPLEVIPFRSGVQHRDGHIGKIPAVVEWAGQRPLCWFDDDFQPDDEDWALERTETVAPTHIIPVDPTTGLEPEHIEAARDFLLGVRSA
ncbi:hypothetical protein HLB23_08350 [Nocardia uniformis]|uniref:Secreted protein n=1 Tax=Nocardia uniformis TaxID=53432 RepID=A0A849BTC4_9NOCA|nr:HAD domain-containing protein [Nocardia uniformis]NNH69872.1 hypothetical protein [Nocardia uniformis]